VLGADWPRCRDSEETRRFYEDFLGLPLACALRIEESKTGRTVQALHTFYRLDDGSYLAFFDVPAMPFEFKSQHDFDLHIALEVDTTTLEAMCQRGRSRGIPTRGISDHEFIRSAYFQDPNGYVVELTAKQSTHDVVMAQARTVARSELQRWQQEKPDAAA
jgi:catechol 2,3-dioxygenase-like lactoylglutathione lyase family enzyme